MGNSIDIIAINKLQRLMNSNDLWLISHAELNFDAVIQPQKSWPVLLTIIKKAAKDGLGGAVKFVDIDLVIPHNVMRGVEMRAAFKLVLSIKSKPITLQLSQVKLYHNKNHLK